MINSNPMDQEAFTMPALIRVEQRIGLAWKDEGATQWLARNTVNQYNRFIINYSFYQANTARIITADLLSLGTTGFHSSIQIKGN